MRLLVGLLSACSLFVCLLFVSGACGKGASTGPAAVKPGAKPGAKAVTITTTKVAGNVWMLQGQGGNIGVSAGADGVLMVDDQFSRLAPKILAAIRALGKGDPTFVVNTHWHGDHTGGNADMGKFAKIIAHENARKRLTWEVPTKGRTRKTIPRHGLPVITFPQAVSLHFNGEQVNVIHFPTGHTDGDSVVFFTKSDVIHMGDHFFNGRFPFVDTNSGGNVVQYLKNVAKVLSLIGANTKIIPGHGELASKPDLQRFHNMILETMGVVAAAKKAGTSLADIQKAGLPKYEAWGKAFIKTDKWIATLYNGLP